ncbi:MAG TPA: NAD-dependent succinate-semialdehyde dehydrogenase [Gemmatimonadaceae bacterium]|nr:NAD-dependent succinate-semialdehyde dehydrogenase [Gemmatimonadaceae bacterium]
MAYNALSMAIATINPATGRTLEKFPRHSAEHVEECLRRAERAAVYHRGTSFRERSEQLTRAADILERERQELGRMMTLEMGKPIAAAVSEAEKCAAVCRYYAANGERLLADEHVETGDGKSWVAYHPLGVVLAVMPWNFPFWQVFRFAAPALMAGNVGILKHASNVPRCALAIEDILHRAGFAEGVFQTLLIGAQEVEGIVADRRVAAVTLTGSEGAGRSVAAAAGMNLKKCVVELGGSDPFIVMPSADMDEAVKTAVTARMINNGQSCIAAKRFIVHTEVYDAFLKPFVQQVSALRVGDPMLGTTQLGPLATEAIRDELAEQVDRSVAAGAKVLTGGKRIEGDGNYYAPTVLVDIPGNAPAHDQELFGPVASVFRVANIEEAISVANGTVFGLGASAWTAVESEQERFVREIEAGLVFINGMVASDPRLPFGGVKSSGYGRELGVFGIREFVNIKTVRVMTPSTQKRSDTE